MLALLTDLPFALLQVGAGRFHDALLKGRAPHRRNGVHHDSRLPMVR